MSSVNVKRLAAILFAILLVAFAVKYETGSSSSHNPYVSTAKIAKIPDHVNAGIQTENGIVIDMYAGTKSTMEKWNLVASYSMTSTVGTKIEILGTKTITTAVNAVYTDQFTATYLTAGPDINKSETKILDDFIAPYDVIGQYPFVAHVVTRINNTPIVVVYNPYPTTIVLSNMTTIPYIYVHSYTTSINGVKHILITSVHGQYILNDANYTIEILP